MNKNSKDLDMLEFVVASLFSLGIILSPMVAAIAFLKLPLWRAIGALCMLVVFCWVMGYVVLSLLDNTHDL
ncbi:MAG: hypothetical protein VW443_04650 [Pseudomonadales bacterium]|jgi:hypothetical protein